LYGGAGRGYGGGGRIYLDFLPYCPDPPPQPKIKSTTEKKNILNLKKLS